MAYGGVDRSAEALGNAAIGGHAELAAAEDVAAGEVLAHVAAEEEVAEGVGELAVDLVGGGGGELQHDVGDDGVGVGAVRDARVGGGSRLDEEELLRVKRVGDADAADGVGDEVVAQPAGVRRASATAAGCDNAASRSGARRGCSSCGSAGACLWVAVQGGGEVDGGTPVCDAELHRHVRRVDEARCCLEVDLCDAERGQELGEHDLLELGDDDVADEVKLGVLGHAGVALVLVDRFADAVVLPHPHGVLRGEEGVLGRADVASDEEEAALVVRVGGERQKVAFRDAQAARVGLAEGALDVLLVRTVHRAGVDETVVDVEGGLATAAEGDDGAVQLHRVVRIVRLDVDGDAVLVLNRQGQIVICRNRQRVIRNILIAVECGGRRVSPGLGRRP